MKALTVLPLTAGSARLDDIDEPPLSDGPVLVETLAVGVCGTDIEITSGAYGWAPPGRDRLVLGHESLGRVLEAPAGAPVAAGDLVVGIVRRPDPVPCANCAVGEWDFCRNGQYTERGIKQRDGYCSERYRIEPDFVVKIDPALGRCGVLLEPTSVVAKAWEQVDRIGGRAHWAPTRAVITGAGPIGLLAALIGVQRGMEVHVLDQVTSGPEARPGGRPRRHVPHGHDRGHRRRRPTSSSSAPASARSSSTPWSTWVRTASSASPACPRAAAVSASTPACSTGRWSWPTRPSWVR